MFPRPSQDEADEAKETKLDAYTEGAHADEDACTEKVQMGVARHGGGHDARDGADRRGRGHAADDPVDVVVDGNDIRADNVNGLTYKGLGVLSCNSTSNLLMDYKAEHPQRYWQLIRVLFGGENPLVNHVKVEMGSDTNTSTGADPATMRTADELADAARSPGFQLAADAKTVNPKLKVSILRWEMPQWVQQEWNKGTGTDEMYRWYKETILDVYEKYGYMVDYVDPDKNETRSPDISFIKWYKNAVVSDTDFANRRYGIPADERGAVTKAYHRIKIVASDENNTLNMGPAMLSDADLFGIVDAAGYHYTTDDRREGVADSSTYLPYTKLATGDNKYGQDKEVWYSEGTASFGYTDYRVNNNEGPNGASTGIGGVQSALDVANRLVKSYANSKRTHYVFQPHDRLLLRGRPVQPQGTGERARPVVGISALRRGAVCDAAVHPVREDRLGERHEHGRDLADRSGGQLQRGERHRERRRVQWRPELYDAGRPREEGLLDRRRQRQ